MHQLEYYVAAIVRVKVFASTIHKLYVLSKYIYMYYAHFHFVAVALLRHISQKIRQTFTSFAIKNTRIEITD